MIPSIARIGQIFTECEHCRFVDALIAVTALVPIMTVAMMLKRYPDPPGLAMGNAISTAPMYPHATSRLGAPFLANWSGN
jgi:hypothetical protein